MAALLSRDPSTGVNFAIVIDFVPYSETAPHTSEGRDSCVHRSLAGASINAC
jgi:hypothetical protein